MEPFRVLCDSLCLVNNNYFNVGKFYYAVTLFFESLICPVTRIISD
jgi:hypothetical protein